jgi:hypothetical protein
MLMGTLEKMLFDRLLQEFRKDLKTREESKQESKQDKNIRIIRKKE